VKGQKGDNGATGETGSTVSTDYFILINVNLLDMYFIYTTFANARRLSVCLSVSSRQQPSANFT